MRKKIVTILLALITTNTYAQPHFNSSIHNIPLPLQKQMQKYTWRPGCPLAINKLSYIELSYWGYDNKVHEGALIVNKALAQDVVHIFKKLFQHQFPIQSITPIEFYQGNDHASMQANNTSAFNCRAKTNQPNVFSQHSYGRAIDINPLINPFVDGEKISPPAGKKFAYRNKPYPGKITDNDFVVTLFKEYKWDWGGNWYDLQDYQHFEKQAHGRKRNPHKG